MNVDGQLWRTDKMTGEAVPVGGSMGGYTTNPQTGSLIDNGGTYSALFKRPDAKGTEFLASGFATRIESTQSVLTELGEQFTGPLSGIGRFAPNVLKSADRQRFEQAERDFINATLRRESGAAIADSEFDNARKQYIPQAGDSQEVLAQKQQNRQNILNALKAEAGPAYLYQKGLELKNAFPDATEQELVEIYNELNNIENPTVSASGDANAIASAIRSVESNNNYDAVGDAGTSRGAYQFNGQNFEAWSQQYFGQVLPFTPENQDRVALARIQDLLDQGYNAEQVALIWNGGEPRRKSGFNASIGLSYDSGAYADKVLAALNNSPRA